MEGVKATQALIDEYNAISEQIGSADPAEIERLVERQVAPRVSTASQRVLHSYSTGDGAARRAGRERPCLAVQQEMVCAMPRPTAVWCVRSPTSS